MARLNVNPTRQELKKLKNSLKTATRGHKLLKDKSDEMIRQFVNYVRLNKKLRDEVDEELALALKSFMLAKSSTSSSIIEEAISVPTNSIELECTMNNVMSVNVPKIEIKKTESKDMFPYSFISVNSELDTSITALSGLLEKLLRLAQIEKTCNMLADEIEKNKRRVNALEYVIIPQTEETIKYITMKLEENERGSLIRLMKVKSMIEERERVERS